MGHRLSKIYTRTGDDGTTGLGDGARTDKDSSRVEACGTVDELNSAIGLLATHSLPDVIRSELVAIQHELFDIGGELSLPGHCLITDTPVKKLEDCLEQLNAELSPLKEFILPGGVAAAAVCHQARAIARRAERRVVSLMRDEEINPASLRYLNRLSDLLFVMARVLNHRAGIDDELWQRGR